MLKGGLLVTIAIMSYLEIDEMIQFQFPITIGIFSVGCVLILVQCLNLLLLHRRSVLRVGKLVVALNILVSLIDLALGVFTLLFSFTDLNVLELNDTQINYINDESTTSRTIGVLLIIASFIGFWMTYLNYLTLEPLQSMLLLQVQVQPKTSIRAALAKKFTKVSLVGDNKSNADSANYQQSAMTPALRSQHLIQQTIMRSDRQIELHAETPEELQLPSTNTVRLPSHMDEVIQLRKPRNPNRTLIT